MNRGSPAPGSVAPRFSAPNQDGKEIDTESLRGKFALIYFYPMDNTPGCTTEACALRDSYSEFSKLNCMVFGVSRQNKKSHAGFRGKLNLPFDLLVDAAGAVSDAFGVPRIPLLGFTKRRSVLIDPKGMIVRFYADVDPAAHAKEVLEDIRKASR